MKNKILVEDIFAQKATKQPVGINLYGKAAFTHYLHNHKNVVSQFFKNEALQQVKRILEYKYPDEEISQMVAEEALQYILFNLKKSAPFPEPKNPQFTFIDLFAGIGGFRLAFQGLGGKCIFTSEWDEQAQKTYQANFGEIPFGDITRDETKNFIPDGFDIL